MFVAYIKKEWITVGRVTIATPGRNASTCRPHSPVTAYPALPATVNTVLVSKSSSACAACLAY